MSGLSECVSVRDTPVPLGAVALRASMANEPATRLDNLAGIDPPPQDMLPACHRTWRLVAAGETALRLQDARDDPLVTRLAEAPPMERKEMPAAQRRFPTLFLGL